MLILHCPLVTVMAEGLAITTTREPGLRLSRIDPVAHNMRTRSRGVVTLVARLELAPRQTTIVPERPSSYLLHIHTPNEVIRLLICNEEGEWVASETVTLTPHRDPIHSHTIHRTDTTYWYRDATAV